MKKLIALVLSLILCLSLVACSSTPETDTPTTDTPTTDTPATTDEPAKTSTDEPADQPAESNPAEKPASTALPLTTEPVTFRGWLSGSFQVADENNMKLQDSPAYQWLKEKTGISLELEIVAGATANEQFNLMLVSEDYPDYIYYNLSNYVGGMSKYIEDEIIVDLAPYMDEYAPNYQAIRMADESVRRATMTDNGEIGGFFRILTEVQNSWLGPLVREDWLEEAGLDKPETLADWTEMLTAFKANPDCTIPYAFDNTGNDRALLTTYNLPESVKIYPVDGTLRYRYATEEFRQYLTQANQWYQDGLLSPNFYGENYSWDTGELANGFIGATNGMAAFIDTVQGISPDVVFTGVQAPVLEAGAKRIANQVGSCSERVEAVLATITTNCENVPLLMQFFDFIYSDEAHNFAIYGIENETYTVNEKGECVFTDFVKNSEYTVTALMAHYSIYNSLPFENDPFSQYQLSSEAAVDALQTWDANLDHENELIMPEMVGLTAEETEDYSAIMSDIQTLVDETIVRFITGEKPLDEYDSFVDTLYSMGLQDALDIYQVAYERYMHR